MNFVVTDCFHSFYFESHPIHSLDKSILCIHVVIYTVGFDTSAGNHMNEIQIFELVYIY